MRIISGFHDYYDRVQALGTDSGLIYLRDERVIAEEKSVVPASWGEMVVPRGLGPTYQFTPVKVMFCGKMYRGMAFNGMEGYSPSVYWNSHELIAKIYKDCKRSTALELVAQLDDRRPSPWDSSQEQVRSLLDWLDTAPEPVGKALYDAAILAKAPIAIGFNSMARYLTLNGRLSDVFFFRVVNAQEAYQALAMWVSANLTSAGPPPLPIADSVRVQQHGFDKYSFRKPPSKPRRG